MGVKASIVHTRPGGNGEARNRTGDTMIFSHVPRPLGILKSRIGKEISVHRVSLELAWCRPYCCPTVAKPTVRTLAAFFCGLAKFSPCMLPNCAEGATGSVAGSDEDVEFVRFGRESPSFKPTIVVHPSLAAGSRTAAFHNVRE